MRRVRFEKPLTRRAFLRGAGSVAIALPLSNFTLKNQSIADADEDSSPPQRLITYSFSNGCDPSFWNYEMALSPLIENKSRIAVLKNISNVASEMNGKDGHQQGGATLFVGDAMKDDYKAGGISLDQYVSKTFDVGTALGAPLVCGLWRGMAGGLERTPTWYRRSWKEDGSAAEHFHHPIDAFKRLFGSTRSDTSRTSVLDTVIEQYQSLTSERFPISKSNKSRLRLHLEMIREVEEKSTLLSQTLTSAPSCKIGQEPSRYKKDFRGLIPYNSFVDAFDAHIEIITLALQCGLTRTACFIFNSAGEDFVYSPISSAVSEHGSSHYSNDEEKRIYIEYRKFHMAQVNKFVNLIKNTGDKKGLSMLDNTVILVGTEFGESRLHIRSPQPFLLIGNSSSKFKTNQIIDSTNRYFSNDLYRTVLNGLGFENKSYGPLVYNNQQITELLS